MSNLPRRTLLSMALVLAATPVLAFAAGAPESQTMRQADGLEIYLGIIPAEMIRGHPAQHEEATMHRGLPSGVHLYHVMVAVFDAKSGKRVENAIVSATVTPLGLAGVTQTLESMRIADTTTYGNYFDLRGSAHYRIVVQVRQTGQSKPTVVGFDYQHSVR